MEILRTEKIGTWRYCQVRVTFTSETFKELFALWYRLPRWTWKFINTTDGTLFLAALLLPSMRTGEPLKTAYSVSKTSLSNVDKMQAIYHEWDLILFIVNLEVPILKEPVRIKAKAAQRGLFFSLGFDSFYTLLKEQEKIVYLVVHGFDIFREKQNVQLVPQVDSNVKKSLGSLTKSLT
jgi:hypothetical protein